MKALTIWQPWASLIVAGAKPYEFRRFDYSSQAWNRYVEGSRIVIHAGKTTIKRDEMAALLYRLEKVPEETGLIADIALPIVERAHVSPEALPRAAGLGTAMIRKAVPARTIFSDKIADSSRIDQHVWAWPLEDIEVWEPIVPMKGAQGFWNWPAPVKE